MSGAWHHPNRENPRWVLIMKNHLFHKVVTLVQRMLPNVENVMYIRQFIDALEYEYLKKREVLDVAQGIGADSNAVIKAIKKTEEN